MSVRLFIGNLPYTATEADLREHLSSVGAPTSVVLPVDRETGRPRGFAFVDYADRAVAEEAIRNGSTSSPSRDAAWRSARRGRVKSAARRRRARVASAARGRAACAGTRPTGGPGGYGAPPRARAASARPRPSDGGAGAARHQELRPRRAAQAQAQAAREPPRARPKGRSRSVRSASLYDARRGLARRRTRTRSTSTTSRRTRIADEVDDRRGRRGDDKD